ncbi:hypothetical protein GS446_21375 [Rhodococcus hoagii]|nr:hypothetical protein [Prescottella equi]
MTLTLQDVTSKIGSGATPRGGKSTYQEHGVAFIRSQNVLDLSVVDEGMAYIDDAAAHSLRGVTVEPGDVLVNITGDSVARVAIWERPDEARVSQHVAIVRPKPTVAVSRYLQYWLVAPAQKSALLTLAAAGGSRPALTKGMLQQFPFGRHSLTEQRTIAEILGALDDKIAANRRVVARALALGEALVRAGDLVPRPLEEVATIAMGASPRGELLNEEGAGIPFFQGVRDFGAVYPAKRVYTEHPVRIAPDGSVLLAVRAPVGKINLAVGDTAIGRGLASIASDSRPATLFFAMKAFESVWDEFQGGGTVFASVNGADVRSAMLPMPADSQAVMSEERLSALLKRAALAEVETEALAATRDELLPLLMSGAITVKDAEKKAAQEV